MTKNDEKIIRDYLREAFREGNGHYKELSPITVRWIDLPSLGQHIVASCLGTGYHFNGQTSNGIEVRRDSDGLVLLVRRKQGDFLSYISIEESR
jgi:hypothetical protein